MGFFPPPVLLQSVTQGHVEWKTPPTLAPPLARLLYSATAASVCKTRTWTPVAVTRSTVEAGTWGGGRGSSQLTCLALLATRAPKFVRVRHLQGHVHASADEQQVHSLVQHLLHASADAAQPTSVPVSRQSHARLPPGQTLQSL